jgi:large subunit ribosomal protein L24
MKIKKGDNVIVLAGKNKGQKSKVLFALPAQNKVIVEGVNIVKKHQKSTKSGKKGTTVEKTLPIDVSNVAILDPKDNKPTRIGFKVEGGKKIRIAKRSGQKI